MYNPSTSCIDVLHMSWQYFNVILENIYLSGNPRNLLLAITGNVIRCGTVAKTLNNIDYKKCDASVNAPVGNYTILQRFFFFKVINETHKLRLERMKRKEIR